MAKIKCRHADAKEVLEEVSCIDAAQFLDLEVRGNSGWRAVECPFHQKNLGRKDQNIGNCVISPDGKTCKCFACQEHGNAIHMVMSSLGIGFCEATDMLAEEFAPHLLSDSVRAKQKRVCPFSDYDFSVIGLSIDDYRIVVNAADTRVEAKKDIELHPEEKYSIFFSDSGEVLLGRNEKNELKDLYFDDPEFFADLVVPKAEEAKNRYLEMLHIVESDMGKEMLCDVLKPAGKDLSEKELAEFVRDELRKRIWVCEDFISADFCAA